MKIANLNMPSPKFTISQLKKALANKSKEELIAEIATLCQTFKPVKEYYVNLMGDDTDIIAKYKAIITKEFVWTKTSPPKARLSVARQSVTDFKKISNKPEQIAEIMLYFVECVSGFLTDYDGPENQYTSAENMYEDTLKYMEQHTLLHQFADRTKLVVIGATDAYGHSDTLQSTYDDYYLSSQ